jgi:Zn-dependent peptidase ImmA (M78 family)/DNA-binding XRE family transcriptional regulator
MAQPEGRTTVELARRLRENREGLSLTQERVSQALGVPRELISYWENGSRTPSLKQLEGLSVLYRTSPPVLLGEIAPTEEERHVLLRGIEDEGAQLAIRWWLGFLDSWADFLVDLEQELPGPARPPRQLDERETITDARRASALAEKVRDFYKLGQDALPNLYTLLDERDYLVTKANLGSIGQGEDSISGAFYNHPRLGFCILVNADTSPGRQAFTLAHEFAHSLYHHAKGGIICRYDADDPVERFANAFAANFLIPGKELRRLARKELLKGSKEVLAPSDALTLAAYFGVSYAMILVRLRAERLITYDQYDEWRRYSAMALARQLGISSDEFNVPEPRALHLDRYPVSVLEQIKRAIEQDLLSPKQAAGLLRVEQSDIQRTLLSDPPLASPQELREHDQFATA